MWNDIHFNEFSDNELLSLIEGKKVIIYGASTRIEKYVNTILKDKVQYIIDSNLDKENQEMYFLKIHNLDYLKKETSKEDIVVISVLKCISLIQEKLDEIGITQFFFEKYRGISGHKDYNKYISYRDNLYIEKLNLKVIEDNKKYKFIHFIYDGKFVKNLYKIIEKYSDIDKHLIVVHCFDYLNENDENMVWDFYNTKNNILIFNEIYEKISEKILEFLKKKIEYADKIIFHSGVLSRKMTQILSFKYGEMLCKSCCIIHGAELDYTAKSEFYSDLIEKMNIIYALNNQDKVCAVYNINPEKVIKFYGNYSEALNVVEKENNTNKINILLGFSATLYIDHLKGIRLLEKYKNENITVYCPLGYSNSDEKYINNVIEAGKECFGDKFIPIKEFIELDKYIEFLSDIDIAVFPNKINCGWTTIASLCNANKKVYASKVMCDMADSLGVFVNNIERINELSFCDFAKKEVDFNTKRIDTKYNFGWKELFDNFTNCE